MCVCVNLYIGQQKEKNIERKFFGGLRVCCLIKQSKFMAGWSILTNGSGLDTQKSIGNCQTKGSCLDIDHKEKGGSFDDSDAYEVKLRCLFDQVLSVFLNEVAGEGCMRPIPPMLGDGQSLDLFKLFCVVRERGGIHIVSENGLWSFVVQDLGLEPCFSGSVKLIYVKYLSELEEWLVGNGSKSLGNGEFDCGGNFKLLSLELEEEFRGLLEKWPNQKIKDDRLALLKCKENDIYVGMDIEKSELDLWDAKDRHAGENVVRERCSDHNEKLCNTGYAYRKRKRESLSGMLNWVIQIATCPRDPSIRGTTEPSKWKDLKVQAIRVREALLRRRHADSNIGHSVVQKSQKMHPSMYDDIPDLCNRSTERLRCSGRLTSGEKSRLCSCCNSHSATESKLTNPCKTELETGQKEKTFSSVTNTTVDVFGNVPLEKQVPVGPRFQASIPEWTGVVVESDSKWLGTQVWPVVDREQYSLIERDFIGRGRPDSCGCPLPGSVSCVRFHIAENRMKLKLELGSAFFSWRFHQMGEEVSLRWTIEEEKRFKDMVKSNSPSSNKRFWDKASKCFHKKTRKDLLSYYFNVFLVRRRSYQNRVTPRDIDSEDDESQFGSFSESFGHEAVTVPDSDLLICSQNRQCFDFE
ncbi:hypothetical protein ACOSQ2_024817 [Xanthoceras sorbifolium]